MLLAAQNLALQSSDTNTIQTLLWVLLIVGVILVIVGVLRLAGIAAIAVNAWGAIIGGAILIVLALLL